MTDDWHTPDPDEERIPERHPWLKMLPPTQRRMVAFRVHHARLAARGQRRALVARIGADFGITERTAARYAREHYPCPCACCLTLVRGGGLCTFCRRHG